MHGKPSWAVNICSDGKKYSAHFRFQTLLRFEVDKNSNRINTLFGHPDTEERGTKRLRKISHSVPVSSKI
jgi:hypothetical protein